MKRSVLEREFALREQAATRRRDEAAQGLWTCVDHSARTALRAHPVLTLAAAGLSVGLVGRLIVRPPKLAVGLAATGLRVGSGLLARTAFRSFVG